MLKISIPGRKTLYLEHLVVDFNGTIAQDGILIPGVADRFIHLSKDLKLYVITADTHGNAAKEVENLPVEVHIIPTTNQSQAKLSFIQQLAKESCVCIGNGVNDALMLKEAGLGIGVLQVEGLSISSLLSADIIVWDINHALDLLLHPLRLVATLRN